MIRAKIKNELLSKNYLPPREPVKVLLTSGASCPDAMVEDTIERLLSFFPAAKRMEDVAEQYLEGI